LFLFFFGALLGKMLLGAELSFCGPGKALQSAAQNFPEESVVVNATLSQKLKLKTDIETKLKQKQK